MSDIIITVVEDNWTSYTKRFATYGCYVYFNGTSYIIHYGYVTRVSFGKSYNGHTILVTKDGRSSRPVVLFVNTLTAQCMALDLVEKQPNMYELDRKDLLINRSKEE